jgi:hypothetical protein
MIEARAIKMFDDGVSLITISAVLHIRFNALLTILRTNGRDT